MRATAMRSDSYKTGRRFYRATLIAMISSAMAWLIVFFPPEHDAELLRSAASAIERDEPVDPGLMVRLQPVVARIEARRTCSRDGLTNTVFIRLRRAEEALKTGELDLAEIALDELERSVRAQIACVPTSGFSWLVLAWITAIREGASEKAVAYLAASYRHAPREGWIARRRNGLVLRDLERFPSELQETAIGEFVSLVEPSFFPLVAPTFAAMNPALQARVLQKLARVDRNVLRDFARELTQSGIAIELPGQPAQELLPWEIQ